MRRAILVIGLAGLFLANTGKGYAADIEAVLDDNAGASEFVVKDSDSTQVLGVSSDGDITLTDTAATVDPWIGLGASAGKIEFDDQTTDEINLLNCNVGIGTTDPGSDVAMTGGLTINGTNHTQLTIQRNGTSGLAINVGDYTSGDVTFYDKVGGVWHQTITLKSGNVGIGTTEPGAKLHIAGTLDDESFIIDDTDGNPTTGVARITRANNLAVADQIPGKALLFLKDHSSNFPFHIENHAGTALFTVKGSGNVGIGTAAPGYKLTIAGGGNVFGVDNAATFLAKNYAGGYEAYLWPRWSDNIMYLNYGSGGFHIRNSSSVSTMFMTNSGNVGIGTTNPGGGTGKSVLSLANSSAAPTALANTTHLYSLAGEGYWMDAAGNVTLQTPHDAVTGEWIFYSKNIRTGRVVRVDMERMVKAIEKLTGEKFMKEKYEAVMN